MDLYKLNSEKTYCVGTTERGVGAWAYLTKTGAELVSEWTTLDKTFLVSDCEFNCPPPSKWFNVQLPDGKWIVAREHAGHVIPDVVARMVWPSFSDYKKGKKPSTKEKLHVNSKPSVPSVVPAEELSVEDDSPIASIESAIESAAAEFVSSLRSILST